MDPNIDNNLLWDEITEVVIIHMFIIIIIIFIFIAIIVIYAFK